MSKFFLTTPIYYVNDVAHIGHAYTTVAADVLARWHRLQGEEVLFLTGTDEHGTKIARAAAAHNKDPQTYCDEIVAQWQDVWRQLRISNDVFIRTSSQAHQRAVQSFLKALWDKGVIYQGRYQGKYCVQCERFYTDDELLGGLCPDHRIVPELQTEDNYFFRLSQFREDLLAAITNEDHPQHFKIFPQERRNEIIGKLKQDVNDLSISRATLDWGVPLPWDRSQTAYVWVDALLNYISAIGYPDDTKRLEAWWPAQLHLMAKDILWFHTVIWPALLMAAGMKMPKKIFAHGFFTVNGQKMSKSMGNVVRPGDLLKEFGVDGTRYLLLTMVPFGADGDFSTEGMKTSYNAVMANSIGNLVSRALNMVEKYCDGKVPAGTSRTLVNEVLADLKPVGGQLDYLQFHLALTSIRAGVDRVNRFIEDKSPWKLVKESPAAVPEVLREVCLCLKALCFYLYPFFPETIPAVWTRLGQGDDLAVRAGEFFERPDALDIPAGQVIRHGTPLFPRK